MYCTLYVACFLYVHTQVAVDGTHMAKACDDNAVTEPTVVDVISDDKEEQRDAVAGGDDDNDETTDVCNLHLSLSLSFIPFLFCSPASLMMM